MSTTVIFLCVIGGLGVVTLSARKSVKQREQARKYRAIFESLAYDLVGKPELPQAHAELLVAIAAIRPGWISRLVVVRSAGRHLANMLGIKLTPSNRPVPKIEQVPQSLRAKYVQAILASAASDSYRSAFFGAVWRMAHPWIHDAVREIKPDVDAHATRIVVREVSLAESGKHLIHSREMGVC